MFINARLNEPDRSKNRRSVSATGSDSSIVTRSSHPSFQLLWYNLSTSIVDSCDVNLVKMTCQRLICSLRVHFASIKLANATFQRDEFIISISIEASASRLRSFSFFLPSVLCLAVTTRYFNREFLLQFTFLRDSSASSSSLTSRFSLPLLLALLSGYQLAKLHHFTNTHFSSCLLPPSRPSAVHFLNSSRQIITAKTRYPGFVLRTIASSVGGVICFGNARGCPERDRNAPTFDTRRSLTLLLGDPK